MTTYTTFTPPRRRAFTFAPTLDGNTCGIEVRWNVFGQRWYVFVSDPNGVLLVCRPMVGSPDPLATTSVVWDGARQLVIVTTAVPHGVPVGTVAEWVVAGVTPGGFNGLWGMRALDAMTLAYAMAVAPGAEVATVQGTVGENIDLIAGYFTSSTLVYRESTNNFEVTP